MGYYHAYLWRTSIVGHAYFFIYTGFLAPVACYYET